MHIASMTEYRYIFIFSDQIKKWVVLDLYHFFGSTLLRVLRASTAACSAGSALARSLSQSLCFLLTSSLILPTFFSSSSAISFSLPTYVHCMYTSNKHHTCIQETNGCHRTICVVRTLNTYLLLFNSNSLNECISILIFLFKLNFLSSQLLLQIIYLQDVYTCTCVYIIVIVEMIIAQH